MAKLAETRITGGDWRGRRIATPRGLDVLRPTRGMVRQALFNILGGEVAGARFLDLYAGAGSVGFEALSRGASRVTFVDRGRESLRVIGVNADSFGCRDRVELVAADAVPWLRRRPTAAVEADVCYVDAPYQDDEMLAALQVLGDLAPPLIVCEHHRARPMPDTLGTMAAVRTAHYGLTDLTMYRPQDREKTNP
ncbi:MAG: 16S rRNA (guanine(966)-N(2))-methyltransferase RsmD [Candidatus Dormibacteria bacterium]|jgi:16S rRNA (guanine966-N2)-methyltransferase